MVGSVGEIFMAVAMVILLAGLLRYTWGGRTTGALPRAEGEAEGDLGLLEVVATVPTREAADVLAARLRRERVRSTVARGDAGWRVLVFPGDADDARVTLRA